MLQLSTAALSTKLIKPWLAIFAHWKTIWTFSWLVTAANSSRILSFSIFNFHFLRNQKLRIVFAAFRQFSIKNIPTLYSEILLTFTHKLRRFTSYYASVCGTRHTISWAFDKSLWSFTPFSREINHSRFKDEILLAVSKNSNIYITFLYLSCYLRELLNHFHYRLVTFMLSCFSPWKWNNFPLNLRDNNKTAQI